MVRRDARASVLGLTAATLFTACGGPATGGPGPDSGTSDVVSDGPGTDDGGLSNEAGIGDEAGAESGVSRSDGALPVRTIASKIDLLFMIDNSASMGDKQNVLAQSVPELISRLVSPNCVDAAGTAIARSQNGQCAQGHVEFTPVHDMHIGIVTSALGGRGADQCTADTKNPTNMALLAHDDDRGELLNRAGPSEGPLADAVPDNFLAWFPNVSENQGQPPPSVTALSSAATLVGDFATAIQGVHEHGCGFEAQNEAWYRFLVQPDPFDHIQINAQMAALVGIDAVILRQRADFLRPDSLVAVIVVTDENEEVADPLAIGGQGWVFENSQFPGSPNYAAPEGTIECRQQDPNNLATTGPNDPKCTSCAFVKTDPNFATRCPKDGTSGTGGFLDPQNDQINVRFYNQKKRFGVSVGYPLSRYVRGLTRPSVPDSSHEHDQKGNYIGDQDSSANCLNPLYATALPTSPTADLCALQRGPRSSEGIYYAAIAGVPHQLLQVDPSNPDSPQKATLSDADWLKITGKDPEHYDFTGADFHMIESLLPRTAANVPPGVVNASNCAPGSSDSCDPICGREWDTKNGDLQFACIFGLPQPKDCTAPQYLGACDCTANSPNEITPLCVNSGGTYTQTQVFGKAYPSLREMVIAHKMGDNGIVSSLCPIHVTPVNNDNPPDPLFGYRPAWQAIVDRFAGSLRGP